MTPIHIACIYRSNDFLAAAAEHPSFDPWIRDRNGRLACDHAVAHANKVAHDLLVDRMYPPGPQSRPDREPS